MQASMQWFEGLQVKRTMFEIMKHTFSQTYTITYCPNKASVPLYSLALLLISTTSCTRKQTNNKVVSLTTIYVLKDINWSYCFLRVPASKNQTNS